MTIFQIQHNKQVINIFLKLAFKLNQIGIIPITYGSLGLTLLMGETDQINDIDLIITDNEFLTHWNIIKNKIMKSMGYKLDTAHWQEFNGHNIPIAIMKVSEIEKLTPIDTTQLQQKTMENIIYYNLSPSQHLDIYKNGLFNKSRKEKKNNEDLKKIKLIEQYIKNL